MPWLGSVVEVWTMLRFLKPDLRPDAYEVEVVERRQMTERYVVRVSWKGIYVHRCALQVSVTSYLSIGPIQYCIAYVSLSICIDPYLIFIITIIIVDAGGSTYGTGRLRRG